MDLGTLELKIARSENLPVLPQVVSAVLKLADDPDASPRAMERVVERDPAITAKILRVANSPFYGGSQVASIGRAISMLGLNSVRSLVVGVAYQQVISGKPLSIRFNKLDFWKHSLAVGTAARILGKLKIPMRAEELFSAGMMHDIGFLVLDKFCPAELDAAIQTAQKTERPMHVIEREQLGFDHAEIGALLSERWGFSPMMRCAIRHHHDPGADRDNQTTTMVIAAANALAYDAGFCNHSLSGGHESAEELMESIGLPKEQYTAIRNVMQTEVMRAQEAYQIR